jgi:hypothetical protein
MTDDLELRLRDSFAAARLPSAPPSLARTLAEVSIETEHAPWRRRHWPLVAVLVGGVVLAGSLAILLLQGPNIMGAPGQPPAPTSSPTATPTLSTDALEGLRTYSVGELKAAMGGSDRPSGELVLRGYWTNRQFMHSCAPPDSQPGELELYCGDGEYGITQLNEPIGTLTVDSRFVPPAGPALTPFIPEDLQRPLADLPYVNNQPYPPVPIVVVGHIDDPRASACRPQARRVCLDRFVIDRIVSFDPTSVPTPAPSPTPSPFPFADPPPAPFALKDCDGDTEYAFVGWKTFGELGIDIGNPNEVLYVVITKHVIQIGSLIDDPEGSGRKFRTMGQRVCFAHEWDQGAIQFTWIPGTAYREWDDGTRTPITP